MGGVPDLVTVVRLADSSIVFDGWSTPPLPLPDSSGFVIGARDGRIFIVDAHDSLKHTIQFQLHQAIDQLLCDSTQLYVIDVRGSVTASDFSGKQLWTNPGIGTLTVPAVLAQHGLILPVGQNVCVIGTDQGTILWHHNSRMSICAVSYSDKSHLIALGLNTSDANGADSVLLLTPLGGRSTEFGFSKTEITSNIAFSGVDGKGLIFGALGEATDSRRDAEICSYSFAAGTFKQIWKHKVPFLVGNIATSATAAFGSGFRTIEGEVVSGVSAFNLADTNILWQRRFTGPLVVPVASGDGNIYFVMNFESEAMVSSRGLFYALSSEGGKTVLEKPMPGATSGLLFGMPMPDGQGRLLVADRAKAVVYALDRSALRRLF
jgi:outer membrane protein assembly factor BamB